MLSASGEILLPLPSGGGSVSLALPIPPVLLGARRFVRQSSPTSGNPRRAVTSNAGEALVGVR